MTMTRPAYYLALWSEALSRPRQYRAGVELRMRRVWNEMTDAERAYVERVA